MILTEYQEAVLVVDYLDLLISQGKVERYLHVNNETYTTSWNQKRRNKRIGGYKGFPDFIILTKDKLFCLELKRKKGGVISQEQNDWFIALRKTGIEAVVAKGFDEAKKVIDKFI